MAIPCALFLEKLRIAFTTEAVTYILITAVFATLLTFYLQSRYQKDSGSTRAGLIYTLEPVFAAIFAYLIHGDTLSAAEWIGGGLLLAAILIAELGKNR